jgi:steroid delta-isomerase-like uncharacterized protein
MSKPDLIRIARVNVEAYNAGDWQQLGGVLAPDVVYDEVATHRRLQGVEKMIEAYRGWKQVAPDGHGAITKAFASGNLVTLEVTWTGTQMGPLAGPEGMLPPTGRQWVVPGVQVISFEGDKIKELRQYFDMMTLLKHIGVGLQQGQTSKGAG